MGTDDESLGPFTGKGLVNTVGWGLCGLASAQVSD